MAGWPPEKNATFTWYFYIRDADGDPVTGATALDVEYSIDGGTFADVAGTEVEEGEGLYSCPISAAEMNGDVIALICKTTTSGAKTAAQVIYTSTRQIDDLAYPATSGRSLGVESDGHVHADLKQWLGVAPLALSSQRVQTEVAAMAANVLTASAIAGDAITAAKIAANAIGADEFAQGAADKVWSSATRNLTALGFTLANTDFAAGAIDAAAIADGAIDAATFASGAINAAAIAGDAITAAKIAAGAIDAATFAAGAIDAAALAADAGNEIADAVLKRDIDQVEATAPKHSLTTAILKAVSRIVDDAGTLKVYRTDGSTLHMSQTITVNATADPIDELTVGV